MAWVIPTIWATKEQEAAWDYDVALTYLNQALSILDRSYLLMIPNRLPLIIKTKALVEFDRRITGRANLRN